MTASLPVIRLRNSMTGAKEDFEPLDPANVRMYVCGPTVYDRAHLGNARPVVVFDVLYRLLRHIYGAEHVTYVRNFTDVDDKINAEALRRRQAGAEGTLEALIRQRTEETIAWYHEDMDALGALRPSIRGKESAKAEPRATEYIEPMKEMIRSLIEKGHAYVVRDGSNNPPSEYVLFDSQKMGTEHVLFEVETFPDYGRLSGRNLGDMLTTERGEAAPNKRNPADFVLWKPSDESLPGWVSDWGRGRPGWHIECSAMSHELLGLDFDIHGGGIDLQFPHHENEIAQSRCAHPDGKFAKYWLHNEMVMVDGKKMSKSLGNFFTVHDLLEQGVPGEVIRFVMLMTHYRSPMDWTEAKRREAEIRLDRLLPALRIANELRVSSDPRFEMLPKGVQLTLCDDLNTSGAIICLENQADLLLKLHDGKDKEAAPLDASQDEVLREEAARFVSALEVLGLFDAMLKRNARKDDTRALLDDLETTLFLHYQFAKKTRDFTTVDRMKADLTAAGVVVRILKDGVELEAGPEFDREKVEALR